MTEQHTITRYGPEDLEAAFQNVSLFWEVPPAEEALRSFLAEPRNVFIAAQVHGEQAGQAIGYILPRWDGNPPMLFLYTIDVLPVFRRRGVGRKLIEAFRRAGERAGCGKTFVLTSETNAPAMALYAGTGARRPHDDDVMFVWDENRGS